MNILVVTRSAWRNDNNTGNTMTNIFSYLKNENIFGLSMRSELPDNNIIQKNFCISEKQFINFWLKNKPIGIEIDTLVCKKLSDNSLENVMYNNAKKFNCMFLWYLREFLWSISPWKNVKLKKYLDEVKPDIIFMPVFGCWYPNKILSFIKSYTNAKVILFHADDNYTLKKFSLSPLFWLYRFNLRRWIRHSIKISDINYAISDIQKTEYEKIFECKFDILYKGYKFNKKHSECKIERINISMLYTGNISSGRYKSLKIIGEALKLISENIFLNIYTLTPITNKIKKSLSCPRIKLNGGVTNEEVVKLQKDADILVHVESFDLKNRLAVRQSFSTKLVDYFYQGKCIFAVGPKDVASIDYLMKNDAAVVATNEKEIYEKLKMLVENPDIIREYGDKAWDCGKRNHQIDKIQKMLYEDFERVIHENSAD